MHRRHRKPSRLAGILLHIGVGHVEAWRRQDRKEKHMQAQTMVVTPGAPPVLDNETYELVQELFRIVRAGDVQRVTRLLEMGLAPNLRDGKGDSLLMLAAYHGHAGLVEALLRHGGDTELVNDRGQTPLAAAAFKGHTDIIRLLLDNGARVDARLPGGRTALMVAAMFDRTEALNQLLAHGADPALADEQGATARHAADMMGAASTGRRLEACSRRPAP